MPATPRLRPRADILLLGIVIGWGALVVVVRIVYFAVVEPTLGISTYVYISGRSGNNGYSFGTSGWTTVLWVIAGANAIMTAITALLTVVRDKYMVLPTVLGLFFAGLSTAFILGQGVLSLVDAPAGVSFLSTPVLFVGGPLLALASILFLPARTRKVFTRASRYTP